MKHTDEIEINVDDETFTVNYTANYDIDHDYGADADGRRGEKLVYLTDINLNYVLDSVGYDIKEKLDSVQNEYLREILEDECLLNENKQ